ncbi:hypothetical protein FQN54_009033 [Arachnomyces sp. PD_36]|nr:hypothetical protein FQN54_009033 [Arachnomyces sp. PD_36]
MKMASLLFPTCVLSFTIETYAHVFTWPRWTFKTVDFQPLKLDIIRTDEDPTPGLIFLGPKMSLLEGVLPKAGATATIYDQEGNLVWEGPDVETSNLQVQTLFGKPVLTYCYEEIYTVTLKEEFITPEGSSEDSYIDLHESKITERNTILVTSYNIAQIDTFEIGAQPDTWVLDSKFHEIDIATNEVLFSWSALDHPEKIPITESRTEFHNEPRYQDNPWDVHHINSIDDAASGYVISLRHTSSILYINEGGSIRWHIDGQTGGDFDLCDTCRFSWQHHVTVYDETPDSLTLAIFNDDGKEGPDKGQPTTELILNINSNTMSITNQRTLLDSSQTLNSDIQGSIQVLDPSNNPAGNILLGYGSWATFKEFNADGNVIWTGRFGPDTQIASYRTFKADWHATPWYPPNVKATVYQSPTSQMSTHFYVSWNGATDVAEWNFYAQKNPKTEHVRIGSVPKTGFETQFMIEGFLDRVSVEAVLVNGTVLLRSEVYSTEMHDSLSDFGWVIPVPDDPAEIVSKTLLASTHKNDEEVDGTDNPDPNDPYPPPESAKQTPPPSYFERNTELPCSQTTCMMNETDSWVELGIIFFIFSSLVSAIMMCMHLFRRHKRVWRHEWTLQGVTEV